MQVALQATHIGRFKGAEFAPEGLVVAVVRLHMSIQAGDEKTNKQTNNRGREIRGEKKRYLRTKGQQTRTGSGANEVDERKTASALCSTASTLMISAARLLFMFSFFVLSSPASKALHSVYLTNNSHTFPMTTGQGSRGGELIYPQSPSPSLVEIECARACGDSGCVFNASPRGGMGMQPVSGSGHIQYRGITPGSSEEMRTHSLPLPHPRLRVCVMDKTNRTSKTACLAAVFARRS